MTGCLDQQAIRDFIADSEWFSDAPDALLDRITAASLPARRFFYVLKRYKMPRG